MVNVGNSQNLLGKTDNRTAADTCTAHVLIRRFAVFRFGGNHRRAGAHADNDCVLIAGNVKTAAADAFKFGQMSGFDSV